MYKHLPKALTTLLFLGGSSALATPSPTEMTCTMASYYGVGDVFHSRRTASGEIFDAYKLTAAHRSLPFGTILRVVNPRNSKTVVVKINDRGPFIAGRGLDLSYQAFKTIGDPASGVLKVCYYSLITANSVNT